jgi:GNAT superfamily N-acetyltransferase
MTSGVTIRGLDQIELQTVLDWAADEGWNPGLHDAAAFFAADPDGFLGLFVDDELVVTASIVRYDASFAFAGCYICRPDRRGEGLGLTLSETALARSDAATIGLDGVLEQVPNYERLGFVSAYRNVRYGGEPDIRATPDAPVRTLGAADLPSITRFEEAGAVFPWERRAFLERWLTAPGSVGRALGQPGEVRGYGVIRPSRSGHRIGPLFCETRADAEQLVASLVGAVGGGLVFLDVPAPNPRAESLALDLGLQPSFETARMYRGPEPGLALDHVFGITTFELG